MKDLTMTIVPKKGMISVMQSLPVITGDEYFEVIQPDLQGTLRNFKVLLSDVRANTGLSAYEIAITRGFEGTVDEWLESLVGLTVYQVAQETGFEGTKEEFLLTLKGDDGKTGKSAFDAAVEGGYEGTEENFNAALKTISTEVAPAISGAVFIRNVTPISPTENVGNKVYANDNKTLLSCTSTTNGVTIHLDAVTGHTSYKPEVMLDNKAVVLTANPSNELIWKGQITIENVEFNESGRAVLDFDHNDGAKGKVLIVSDVAPAVSRAVFTSTYPGDQVEFKEDDKVSIEFDADTDVVAYEIKNSGALKAFSGSMEAGVRHAVSNLSIAGRSEVTEELPFEIRVRKASGAWSEWYSSGYGGVTDLVNTVKLNNLYPTIVVNSVTYPGEQTAIKGTDTATVNYSLNNYTGAINVTPIGHMLEVVSVDVNAAVVKLTETATTSASNNLKIELTRADNGAVTTVDTTVVVANEAPKIDITLPAARLRSGGNYDTEVQSHVITLTASQELLSAPTLTATIGTWESAGWTSNTAKTVWTRKLNIHDDDAKGSGLFAGLSAMSTAGIEATVINSGDQYEVGGFVRRILNVLRWTNRTTDIGTMVVDTSKLLCSNLSQGQENSYNTQYKADDENEEKRYTIKDGNTWYNCDVANAVANTQDAVYIDIEETV